MLCVRVSPEWPLEIDSKVVGCITGQNMLYVLLVIACLDSNVQVPFNLAVVSCEKYPLSIHSL